MDYISSLPNELLRDIFDYIGFVSVGEYQHLVALTLVSRRFNSVATQMLYQCLRGCCPAHVRLIDRTISSNPQIADKVRTYVDNELQTHWTSEFAKYAQTEAEQLADLEQWNKEAAPRAATLGFSLGELYGTRRQNIKALESLTVISKCRNILEVILEDEWSLVLPGLLRKVIDQTVPGTLNCFNKLHKLSLTVNLLRRQPLSCISIAFRLPSLRSLTIKKATLDTTEEEAFESKTDQWECAPQESLIQELTFEECGLDYRWISRCILSCRTLRRFRYEFYQDCYPQLDGSFLLPGLYDALLNYKDIIEAVHFGEIHGCRAFWQFRPYKTLLWTDFPSLTHLNVPLCTFYSRNLLSVEDIFPPSLKVLKVDVRSTRDGFSDAFFLSLANAIPQYLKALREIEVTCRIDHFHNKGFLPLHTCHLQRFFASLNLEFRYSIGFVSCKFFGDEMRRILRCIKKKGPDGQQIAKHTSLIVGCLNGCTGRSSPEQMGLYMKPWVGPGEFEPGFDDN